MTRLPIILNRPSNWGINFKKQKKLFLNPSPRRRGQGEVTIYLSASTLLSSLEQYPDQKKFAR